MKIEAINVEKTIENTRKLLAEDSSVSPALKSSIELLLVLVTLLLNQLGLNSSNSSSKSPSTDPNRKKKKKKTNEKQPGGQKGHNGTTLQKFPDPDVIEKIPVDKTTIPEGAYKDVGYESRQIVDIDISRVVTEYRAQVLENANGNPGPHGQVRVQRLCHLYDSMLLNDYSGHLKALLTLLRIILRKVLF